MKKIKKKKKRKQQSKNLIKIIIKIKHIQIETTKKIWVQ